MTEERKILVGRLYSRIDPSWTEWKAASFDEAIGKMQSRRSDDAPKIPPDEILEVIVVRRAVIRSTIQIEVKEETEPEVKDGKMGWGDGTS